MAAHQAPHPWDSPGKNTGVGCHFLLPCVKVKSESEVAQSCLTLRDPMDCSCQAPPPMGFSRQEYWSGVPLPSPQHELVSLKSRSFSRWTQTMSRAACKSGVDGQVCTPQLTFACVLRMTMHCLWKFIKSWKWRSVTTTSTNIYPGNMFLTKVTIQKYFPGKEV